MVLAADRPIDENIRFGKEEKCDREEKRGGEACGLFLTRNALAWHSPKTDNPAQPLRTTLVVSSRTASGSQASSSRPLHGLVQRRPGYAPQSQLENPKSQLSLSIAMSGPAHDQLDQRLSADLPPEAQPILIETLWGSQLKNKLSMDGLEFPQKRLVPFLKYYSQQCDFAALHSNTTLTTHRQIANVAALIRQPGGTWQSLLHQLPPVIGSGTEDQYKRALYLVSRLLTMIRIGEVPQQFTVGRSINWNNGTLAEFVNGYFPSNPVLGHERIKFEKTFNAMGLVRIAGIEVQWTDNLADHLRLANDDRVVRVFHHTTFLFGQEDR